MFLWAPSLYCGKRQICVLTSSPECTQPEVRGEQRKSSSGSRHPRYVLNCRCSDSCTFSKLSGTYCSFKRRTAVCIQEKCLLSFLIVTFLFDGLSVVKLRVNSCVSMTPRIAQNQKQKQNPEKPIIKEKSCLSFIL